MTCDQIERDEIAERYLLGRLSADEQERFEVHYFDCKRCLERLQVMEAAQAELSRETSSIKDVPASSRRWWRTAQPSLPPPSSFLPCVCCSRPRRAMRRQNGLARRYLRTTFVLRRPRRRAPLKRSCYGHS